jgi:hypothetical protein
MPRPRNKKVLAGVLLAISFAPLAGCADYLNHRDTITLAAGDATNSNVAIHTIDPQANRGEQAVIYSDGKYIRNVMDNYHQRPVTVVPQGYNGAPPVPQPPAN